MEITFSSEEKEGFLIKTAYFGKDPYFFKIPLQYKDEMTDLSDPFVILLIFKMMELGGKFFIKGKVSKSLLDNMELYTSYWKSLLPEYYKKIEIIADEEIQDDPKPLADKAIATFSGGLDASFMLYRHKKGLAGRNNRNIEKAVFISGFNTLGNEKEFNASKNMCDDLGVELIPVEINYRHYSSRWSLEHFACLAGVLRLWKNYPYQLLASSWSINSIELPWGSNPITDPILSSNRYKVIIDDSDFSSTEKADLIKEWETGLANILVCWYEPGEKFLNCGECEKCIRTHLNFRAVGRKRISSMASDLTIKNIKNIKFNAINMHFYQDILNYVNKNNIIDNVFIELQKAIKKYHRKESRKWITIARAKILSKITFGEKKRHYIKKVKNLTAKKDNAVLYHTFK